ncbi:MAG: hypothetical protein VX252_04165 [Myxococcota bacterium]|nr:hypothetical protein [Myxococcota bacterium]
MRTPSRSGLPSSYERWRLEPPEIQDGRDSEHACRGFCRDCGRVHSLPEGGARPYARQVMAKFEEHGRLDYDVSQARSNPRLALDRLFPRGRGHMFGVLECRARSGETVFLRAFSSLHDGIREVAGWVPPLLSPEEFYGLVLPTQHVIRDMTTELEALEKGSAAYLSLLDERKEISRDLLKTMQDLYRFVNFRGESRSLSQALCESLKVPGVVGECCAPKLLTHAARQGLTPKSMAEFYFGGTGTSGRLVSGDFYPPCESRCQPILGFLLCGLDDER